MSNIQKNPSIEDSKWHVPFLMAILLFIVPLSALIGMAWMAHYWRSMSSKERVMLELADERSRAEAINEIETICVSLGRTPFMSELDAHLNKPLPLVHDNGVEVPIKYHRIDDSSYQLRYELWATDDWVYDSRTPEKGWVQQYY